MVKQSINIDFATDAVQPRLYASQYDTGERVFLIHCMVGLEEYIIPSDAIVSMVGRKPGNEEFSVPGYFENNEITFDCTSDMTDTRGYVKCELKIETAFGVAQSANFILYVERSVTDDSGKEKKDIEKMKKDIETLKITKQDNLFPGSGIRIYVDETTGVLTIAATGGGGGGEYFEGTGIKIDGDNRISIDPEAVQIKLVPGEDVTIDEDGNISFNGVTKEKILEALGLEENDIEFADSDGRKIIVHTIGEVEEILPTYTVTFDSDGGTEVPAQTVTSGETITEPEPPTRGTDTFLGWFEGDDPYDFTRPVTGNFTIVANWEV